MPEFRNQGVRSRRTRDGEGVSTAAVVELLGDEFVRTILEQIRTEYRSARELATDCDVSRPTVYRRLDRLEDAGLVETTMTHCSDGHHRREFRAAFGRVAIELADDGLAAAVVDGREAVESATDEPARPVGDPA